MKQSKALLLTVLALLATGILWWLVNRDRGAVRLHQTGRLSISYRGTNVSPDYQLLLSRTTNEPWILFIRNPRTGFTKIFQVYVSEGRISDHYQLNYSLRSNPLLGKYYLKLPEKTHTLDVGMDLRGYFPDYTLSISRDTNRLEFNLPRTGHAWYKEFDLVRIYPE